MSETVSERLLRGELSVEDVCAVALTVVSEGDSPGFVRHYVVLREVGEEIARHLGEPEAQWLMGAEAEGFAVQAYEATVAEP